MGQIRAVQVRHLTFLPGELHICVPITGKTIDEIVKQTKEIIAASPDLVEWRGDLYEDIMDHNKAVLAAEQIGALLGEIPLLFTFRSKNEGGNKEIAIEEYVELNRCMAASDAVYMVDVEAYMDLNVMPKLIDDIHKNGKIVVGSHHRFDGTPAKETMIEVLKNIEESGADLLKLAVMPHDEADVERLIAATKETVETHVSHPVVTMSMGSLGVRTRVEGKKYGSCMTFGCVGETSAPGQLEIDRLRERIKQSDSERQPVSGNRVDSKNMPPSIDQWLQEAKCHESAPQIGMYLTHNGIVRQSAKAKVRFGQEGTKEVTGMIFSYDQEKVDYYIQETYKMDGIYYVRVWLNEGELSVGDDIMYVLIGGDIRPHVVEALQFLVEHLKKECVQETELY